MKEMSQYGHKIKKINKSASYGSQVSHIAQVHSAMAAWQNNMITIMLYQVY